VGDPCQPYLSLPTLTAFLKRAGRPVIQRDLNIEAYNAFLSPARLQKSYAIVTERLTQLESQSELSDSELAYHDVLARIHLTAPYVIAHVEEAKEALRSPDTFYDFERYGWSIRTLSRAMVFISAEYYPTNWGLGHFQTRHTKRRAWSVPRVLETIRDKSENPFVKYFREQIVPSLQQENPNLIGISITYFNQVIPGLTLASEIKRVLPQTHLCVGGAVITELAGRLERNPKLFCVMDSIITHEGEHALLALAQQLERGESLESVPNLLYLAPSGEVIRNPLGPIEDINALPTPDFTGLPLSLYFAPEPVFLLATSRGCYWKRCAFCTVSTAVQSSCYRPRAKELVRQDIHTLISRYQARSFFLSDDSVAPNRLRMMAGIMQELGYPINWECESRLEGFTEELCHLIASAGCRRLIFGLESASQRVLDLMDKGTRIETIEAALHHCQSAGIAVNLQSFIGFPGEIEAEARQTLRFLLENRDKIHSVAFGEFLLQQGSKVQQNPAHYGVTHIDYPPGDVLATCYDYQVSVGMTPAEVKRVRAEGLGEIQKAYSYLSNFHGHDVGPHSFLYLIHHGAKAMRNMPQREPTEIVEANFSARIPVIPADVAHYRYRNGGNGNLLFLLFSGRSGQVMKADLEIERFLDLCDGRASIGQVATHLAGQCDDIASYLKTYYRTLSLARTCVQNGILELN